MVDEIDVLCAFQVEVGDIVRLDGNIVEVVKVTDDDDFITFVDENEEEHNINWYEKIPLFSY